MLLDGVVVIINEETEVGDGLFIWEVFLKSLYGLDIG